MPIQPPPFPTVPSRPEPVTPGLGPGLRPWD
jgi:hypothetical protein